MRNKRHKGAGLLPAAVEEIKRLRAEWAALKDSDLLEASLASIYKSTDTQPTQNYCTRTRSATKRRRSCEILRGVVALVEVGTEGRALPLRAALTALGASVVPLWSPLVTHVVWSEGGCREARAQARASAAHVVSPLWVEACAAEERRLPEKMFPAATRPSDLPSPATLLNLLKKADQENVQFADVTAKDKKTRKMGKPSTVTSRDVSADDSQGSANSSLEPKAGPSGKRTDKTNRSNSTLESSTPADSSATVPVKSILKNVLAISTILEESFNSNGTGRDYVNDVETRVNTQPRRALPRSTSPGDDAHAHAHYRKPEKSMRKLFTQREVEPDSSSDEDSETEGRKARLSMSTVLTQRDRAGLARAERIARRIVQPGSRPGPSRAQPASTGGLFSTRYQPSSSSAPRARGIPETFIPRPRGLFTQTPAQQTAPARDNIYSRDGRIRIVLTGMERTERLRVYHEIKKLKAKVQKTVNYKTTHVVVGVEGKKTKLKHSCGTSEDGVQRTLSALAGAARGCRVVFAHWVYASVRAQRWLNTNEYAVPHLKNIAEKAYVERKAFDLMHSEYAYNVFHSRRVRLMTDAENRHAAEHLLALCGAVVVDDAGNVIHNAELEAEQRPEFDITTTQPPGTSQPLGNSNQRPCTSSSNQRSGTSTQRPNATSQRPGITNERPGNSTQRPGTTKERPGTSHERPGTTKERPVISNQRPGTSAQDTANPTGNIANMNASTLNDKEPPSTSREGFFQPRPPQPRNSGRKATGVVAIGPGSGEVSPRWVFDSVATGRMRSTRSYIVTANG